MNYLAIIFSKFLIILLFFSLSSCLQEPAKIINKNKTNYNKSNQYNQDKYKNITQNKAKTENKADKEFSIAEDKKIEEGDKGKIIESPTQSKASGKSTLNSTENIPAKTEKSSKETLAQKIEIKVEQGETLYSIAKKNNTNLRDIIELNNIQPPYQVNVGQNIKIPVASFHESRDGDTLYSISRLYNMKVNDLIAINDLKFPYAIYPGDKIKINADKNLKTPEQKPIENIEIAQKNSKDLVKNLKNNKNTQNISKEKILTNSNIAKGKPLNENTQKKEAEKNLAKADNTNKSSEIESYGLKPTEVRAMELSKADENSKTVKNIIPAQNQIVQTKLEINKPIDKDAIKKIANKSNHFAWPVRGEIVSKFGPKSAGLFNDGINIKAKSGQNVLASEDGIIAYVGNELKGYGNLVIIKHAGGWISAYAHLKDFAVNRGQKIYQGQKIGSVGDSGKVKYPQLYFGLRKGRDAVNPETHLNHL